MRKFLFLFLLFGFSLSLFAQPAYDDCPALSVGTAPFCDYDTYFNNVNATTSNIGSFNVPGCFSDGDLSRDVWISFVASDTILDYVISVIGKADGTNPAMKYPEIALYRGDCAFDELAIILCASYNPTVSDTSVVLNAFGLTPGATYYMRIHDNAKGDASVNAGSFVLCIKQKDPIITITDGFSNACSGKLVDSGGETGDYGPNEDFFYKICPAGLANCITFTMDYYNIDNSADEITFYDGDSKTSPVLAKLTGTGGIQFNNFGGVCYQVQASSGCISVEFKSDGNLNLDGFLGSWECSSVPCEPKVPITVVPTATDDQIIASVSTPQTIVTIDTIKCAKGAYGTFTATDNSLLGLEKGLLLTSGFAANAVGPNNSGSATGFNGSLGDSDLDYLSIKAGNTSLSHDACIVELDVFAATDELAFEYIFGSEEYPEFVGSNFNDIFAFLISGPGIVGDPGIGNQKNIAILPDNTTFVEVNSVNFSDNWEYYRNNISSQTIQYDGLTSDFKGVKKSLTARQKVTPCNTYHLKLAIADRGDFSYDSGVFISDLKGGAAKFDVVYNSGIDYLIEKCTGEDVIKIKLSNILDYAVSYNVVIGGTATLGVDYNLSIPSVITFLPGQTELSFPISPIDDSIIEGTETVIILLTNNFGCGPVTFAKLTVEIHDEAYADILNGLDTVYYCKNGKIDLSVKGCQTYFWQPISIMNNFESATPVATPTGDGYIYVTGQVGACSAKDSIFAKEIAPAVSILPVADNKLCQGEKLVLTANCNTYPQGFSWYPPLGLNSTKNLSVTASPLVTTTYNVQVNLSGCIVKDSVTIFVDPFEFPIIVADTFKLCQTYPIKLASDIFFSNTSYQWTPALYLDDPTASGPIATPDKDILYTLIATSQNGYCKDTAKVYVDVIEADVNILDATGIQKDSFQICKGDSLQLNSYIFPAGSTIKWSSKEGNITGTGATSIFAKPTYSQWIVSKLTTSQCVVYDSVFVQVDSLPTNLMIMPTDTTVCQGSIVILQGPVYEQSNFPNLVFNWEPTYDAQTPDSLYNLVIQANASFKYQRFAYSGACVNISESNVNVIPTNLLIVSPPTPEVCPGQSVILTASAADPGVTGYKWSPTDGLSCTECQTTIATLNGTTSYQVEGKFMGCPVKGSVTVKVSALPWVNFPSDNIICKGDSTILNESPDGGFTYVWSSTDPAFPGSSSGNPTVKPEMNATYYVTVTNQIGCTAIYQHDIIVAPIPTITVSDDVTVCAGTPITLTATSNAGGIFTWSDGQTGSSITVNPSVSTIYTVNFEDTYKCGKASGMVSVKVETAPQIGISVVPDSLNINAGDPATLTAIITPPNADVKIAWYFQNQSLNLSTQSINVKPLENPATYQLIVTTPNGCTALSEIVFNVSPVEYLVPNVFTPNGDGKNDIFKLYTKGKNLKITQFRVYNRWGAKVFEGADNTGWDGMHDGAPAPSDAYVYWVVVQTPKGEEVLKGDISLVR